MLGYLFDPRKSIGELGIRNAGPIQPQSDEDFDVVAAAMLAIKYGQIAETSQYGMNLRKEIVKNQAKYCDGIKEKLKVLVEKMAGSFYDVQDIWDVLEEAKENPHACLYVNVPTYKGGYEKMFEKSGITWDEPDIGQFDPDMYGRIFAVLSDAKCTSYVYSQKNLDKVPDGWQTVYAQSYSIDRVDYVVCNKPEQKAYAVASVTKPRKIYSVYADEDITEDSKVEFVRVDKETALYFRDLFVHKLGTTGAEAYFLMLIDGKVVTALGLHTRDVFTMKSEYIGEVFGISRSSAKYKRLDKLFMLCLTSGDFKSFVEKEYQFGIRKIRGIKTSSLTTFWGGKSDRSVMKLTAREQLKSGTFRVVYQGDFRDDTFSDCIRLWLKKWGKVKR